MNWFKEYFFMGLKNLKERKLRSWLTAIGIFIGIAAVVSLISLGQGLLESMNQQFEMLGTDKIFVVPGGSLFGTFTTDILLSDEDLDAIQGVNGVKQATGFIYKIARAEYKKEVVYIQIAGIPQDETKDVIMSMQQIQIIEGRDTKENDGYKAVATYLYAEPNGVFDKPVMVGDSLEVEGRKIKIVGRFDKIGNPQDDSVLYLPEDAARELLDFSEGWNTLFVQTKPGFNVSAVSDKIEDELRDVRGVKEGEEDFTVTSTEDIRDVYDDVLNVVVAVLIGLAGISLFVGGVGIMNTMFTAVLQRTNEIGIMKALGARNRDIALLFVIESGIVGLVGGAAGILAGMVFAKLVEFAAFQANVSFFMAHFPWYLIVGSLAFAFFVGILSGILPAIQAARMKPVDALRYE